MEKESNQGLAIAGPARLELLCYTRPSTAPESSTAHQRIAVPGFRRSRSQPLISKLSRRGSFLQCVPPPQNPPGCQAMKSCPTSVATVWPHPDAESCPILPAVGTGCSSTRVLGAGVQLRLCPRPRPREPASRHLLPACFLTRRSGYPTMPITPLRAKLLLSCPLSQPAKRVRGPPFPVKWLPSRLPKTVRVSYQEQAWSAARR